MASDRETGCLNRWTPYLLQTPKLRSTILSFLFNNYTEWSEQEKLWWHSSLPHCQKIGGEQWPLIMVAKRDGDTVYTYKEFLSFRWQKQSIRTRRFPCFLPRSLWWCTEGIYLLNTSQLKIAWKSNSHVTPRNSTLVICLVQPKTTDLKK